MLFDISKKSKLKEMILQELGKSQLSDEGYSKIRALRDELGLPEEYVTKIREKHFMKISEPVLARVRKSCRYTTFDEEELAELAKRFNINYDFIGNEFQIYRSLWEIKNNDNFIPPSINVSIRLAKGEKCYIQAGALWAQIKSAHVKGWFSSELVEEMVDISGGSLYVTNKRLIYAGDTRSTTITLGRILSFSLKKDGRRINISTGKLVDLMMMRIDKSSGKPDVFRKMERASAEYIEALLRRN